MVFHVKHRNENMSNTPYRVHPLKTKTFLSWGFTKILISLRRKPLIRNSRPGLDSPGRSNMLAFALQELQGSFSPPFDNNLVHPATLEKPLFSGVYPFWLIQSNMISYILRHLKISNKTLKTPNVSRETLIHNIHKQLNRSPI